jgi:hypothetical protein
MGCRLAASLVKMKLIRIGQKLIQIKLDLVLQTGGLIIQTRQ